MQKTPLAAGSLSVLLFFCAALFSIFINPFHGKEKEFWHTLYIEDSSELENAVQFLESEGMGQVSSSLLPVTYSEFTHLNEVPLRDIPHRLLLEDPRFDPFIKELIQFYSSDGGERILFTSNLSTRLIKRLARKSDISFVSEEESGFFVIGLTLVILLSVTLPFLFKKHFYIPLSVILLWLPYLIKGEFSEASVIAVVVLLQSLLSFSRYGKPTRLAALATLALLGVIHCYSRGSYSFAMELLLISGFSWISGILLNRDESPKADRIFSLGPLSSLTFPLFSGKSKRRRVPLRYRIRVGKEHTLFEPAFFSGKREKISHNIPSGANPFLFFGILVLFSLSLLIIPEVKVSPLSESPALEDMIHHLYYQDNILLMTGWNDYPVRIPEHFEWSRSDGSVKAVAGGEILSTERFMADKGQVYTRGFGGSFLFSYDESNRPDVYLEREKYLDNYYILVIIGLFVLYGNLFSLHQNKNSEKISFTTRRGRKVA